jgi:N-methylhydantoinase B
MMIQSVLDEVLANHFRAVVEEMSHRVLRAAHTTFVKETQDYAAALITVKGEAFAYPYKTGVTSLMGIPISPGIEAFNDWQPGDVMITNDPYTTRGMVMHLPDLHLLKPMFHKGRLICFGWAFMHCSDVGGIVPGSTDPVAHELFQEGFRLRPTKLIRAGQRNADVWNFIADNSRIPELNEGDLEALLSALDSGEKRIGQLIDRYGCDPLLESIDRILDGSEQRTRAVLRQIPKGDYRFVDYLEDDYASDVPVRIEVTLRSDGEGAVVLDYHGSDPQVRAALNLPTGGQKHHPFLSLAVVNYIATNSEGLHFNAGILRCIALDLPEASIVNASFPAACGMRYASAMRAHDAVLGALAQATGGAVPAAGAGEIGVTLLTVNSLTDGRVHVAVANTIQGGTGGGPRADGVSGIDYPVAFLRNVPAEVLETEMPVIVRRFGVIPDSEGAGRLRGGPGLVYEVEVCHPDSTIIMRGKERYRFQPWGTSGGAAGSLGSTVVRRSGGEVIDIGKRSRHRAAIGDVLIMTGAGGGGYGDPFERAPERVCDDVLDGFISAERARDVYGVVISDGVVDTKATAALRRKRADREAATGVDRGDGFRAWEARYGAVAERIHVWLGSLPARLRPLAKEQAYARLAAMDRATWPAAIGETLSMVEAQLAGFRQQGSGTQ